MLSRDAVQKSVSEFPETAETVSPVGVVGGVVSVHALVDAEADAFAECRPSRSTASTSTR